MELQSQIRKYRTQLALSQDELAERVFVSRQSISNWENGKTYPDIKSLLLLSEVFGVSLDQLVKGDTDTMKKGISTQEIASFQKDNTIFTVFFIALFVLPIPLGHFLGWYGLIVYLVIFALGIYYAIRVERHKKKHNIHTYKEIVAFTEGKTLEKVEQSEEGGKRMYQKVLIAIGCAFAAAAFSLLMAALFMG